MNSNTFILKRCLISFKIGVQMLPSISIKTTVERKSSVISSLEYRASENILFRHLQVYPCIGDFGGMTSPRNKIQSENRYEILHESVKIISYITHVHDIVTPIGKLKGSHSPPRNSLVTPLGVYASELIFGDKLLQMSRINKT